MASGHLVWAGTTVETLSRKVFLVPPLASIMISLYITDTPHPGMCPPLWIRDGMVGRDA